MNSFSGGYGEKCSWPKERERTLYMLLLHRLRMREKRSTVFSLTLLYAVLLYYRWLLWFFKKQSLFRFCSFGCWITNLASIFAFSPFSSRLDLCLCRTIFVFTPSIVFVFGPIPSIITLRDHVGHPRRIDGQRGDGDGGGSS